jgi:hypothetical protein
MILQTALNDLLELAYDIRVDASPLLEISYLKSDHDDYTLIGLNNLSGQVGTAYHAPLPMDEINIELKNKDRPRDVTLLRSNHHPRLRHRNGITSFTVPLVKEYEVAIVQH